MLLRMADKTEQTNSPSGPKKPRRMRKERPTSFASDGSDTPVHRSQVYIPADVPRWELKNATYNPRFIDPYAKQQLEDEIRRGLVQPPTWNKRTGNIVGGHQRTDALDAIMGPCTACKGKKCERCHQLGVEPYKISVSVIDVDEAEERRLNIVLNNTAIQGQYDPAKLSGLIEEYHAMVPDVDVGAAMHFNPIELQSIGVSETTLGLFQETQEALDAAKEIDEVAQIQDIKNAKKKHKALDSGKALREVESTLGVMFPGEKGPENLRRVMIRCGYGPDDEPWIDGKRLLRILFPEDADSED